MLCYHCVKINNCDIFHKLTYKSGKFEINQCDDYDLEEGNKYRKIADNVALLRLIYDYFMNRLEDNISIQAAEEKIKRAISSL